LTYSITTNFVIDGMLVNQENFCYQNSAEFMFGFWTCQMCPIDAQARGSALKAAALSCSLFFICTLHILNSYLIFEKSYFLFSHLTHKN
jgi:hypothetical protein